MFSQKLELVVDLHPSWPETRLAELYTLLTTRITIANDKINQDLLYQAGFQSVQLTAEPATLRVRDSEFGVDVVSRFANPRLPKLARHPLSDGARVRRFGKSALICLPRSLWLPTGPEGGDCGCAHCAGEPAWMDGILVTYFGSCVTELTHAPPYRDLVARLSITVPEMAKTEGVVVAELYAKAVDVHLRRRPLSPEDHPMLPNSGSFLCPASPDNAPGAVFLRLLRDNAVDDSVRLELKELPSKYAGSFLRIRLPTGLHVPLEVPLTVPCHCRDCQRTGAPMANSLSLAGTPTCNGLLDIAQLVHTPNNS